MELARNGARPKAAAERFDLVDGIRTFSRALGAGTEVVLVHGAGISSRYWRPAQEALARRGGLRVHAVDLPGFGRSADPPWQPDLPRLARHLAAWGERVLEGPCFVIGQSAGCEIAARYALAYPERVLGLVLAGPSGMPRLRSLTGQLLRAALDAPREPAALYAAIFPDYLRCGLLRLIALLRAQKQGLSAAALGGLRVPTLIVRGSRDPVADAACCARVARAIPGAVLKEIPGAHAAHFTHAEAFASATASLFQNARNPGRISEEEETKSAGATPDSRA